jgi:hypothetical protein
MIMARLLRILVVAMLVGPQVAELVLPSVASCEDGHHCCSPDGTCDATLVVCPCCATTAPIVTSTFSAESADAPTGRVGTNPGSAALPLLPTEILHVPKSL